MSTKPSFPVKGGCDCGMVRYQIECVPLFVHCCHCTWCQRETGSAFALNAILEDFNVVHLNEQPQLVDTPSESGYGQMIARCPRCYVAIWSNYSGSPFLRFVRVGTLDEPKLIQPDIHIYTKSKQPWVTLPDSAPAVEEYYDRMRYWPKESLDRIEVILPKMREYMMRNASVEGTE